MQSLFEAVNLKPMEQVLNRILIMTIMPTVCTHAAKIKCLQDLKSFEGLCLK